MALTLTSRKDVRDKMLELMNANLAGSGNPVQQYFDHAPSAEEVDGQSPIGWVEGGPTRRIPRSFGETKQTFFDMIVTHAVRLDGSKDGSWVEDRLDTIEKEFSELFENNDNRNNDVWSGLEMMNSTPAYMDIGGHEYRVEVGGITVEVKD